MGQIIFYNLNMVYICRKNIKIVLLFQNSTIQGLAVSKLHYSSYDYQNRIILGIAVSKQHYSMHWLIKTTLFNVLVNQNNTTESTG